MLSWILRMLLLSLAHVLMGVRAIWAGCAPAAIQRVYYGNHASHGDFLVIWASLPPGIRSNTRPVAGSDYWLKGTLRSYIARQVINAVLIERGSMDRKQDPIAIISQAVVEGSSLIVFPEGTRNTTEEKLLPFKSGIYHLAKRHPAIELVPVWVENLNRVMPKGEFVPIPLLCTATFGAPIVIGEGEGREAFVTRAREALLALAPRNPA